MKKKYVLAAATLALCLPLQSCDSMLVAMDQVNQGYGSVCVSYWVDVKMYNSETGEYDFEGNMIKDSEGNDIKNQEENWINRKMDEYLYAGVINLYYETSPYSDVSYQFKVLCGQWQQQQ